MNLNGNNFVSSINPCKVCGLSAGTDPHVHPYTGKNGTDGVPWGDVADCLCDKCSAATATMTEVREFNAYKNDLVALVVDDFGEQELVVD